MNKYQGRIERHSDQSVIVHFSSCHRASAFEAEFKEVAEVPGALSAEEWIATAQAELDGIETEDTNNCLKAAHGALSSALIGVRLLNHQLQRYKDISENWLKKTDWVQAASKDVPAGVHRADVLRHWITDLQTLSVTNILLDIVPGEEGMGREVYASSMEDVIDKLSELSDKIEDIEESIGSQRTAELQAVQWRNIRKVVKALADLCFGGPNDPRYGIMHTAITTSLTAKDGLDISTLGLEPLKTDVHSENARRFFSDKKPMAKAWYGLRWDAELGRTAMHYVDRAGDVHPGIDDAEKICADFYKAMCDVIERMPHVQRMALSRPSKADTAVSLASPRKDVPSSGDELRWALRDCRANVNPEGGAFFSESALNKLSEYLVDAARWRAFLACGRIRILGTAGLDVSRPKRVDKDLSNYVHFGAEFWSVFDAQAWVRENENPPYARAVLAEFADATRAALVQTSTKL